MSVVKLLVQCVTLYQVLGAPQNTNFPWSYPTAPTDEAVRAQLILPSFNHDQYQPLDYDQLLFNPNVQQGNSYFEPENLIALRQNIQQCDPRNWLQRSYCLNTTVRRTCTLAGIYRDVPCPQNWSCVNGLGICLRPFSLQRPFVCPQALGAYPDLNSCRAFHVCQGNAVPLTTTCYWPQVYDPLTESCQMEGPDTPCYRSLKCYGTQKIAYQGDANIYVNCSATGADQPLARCPPQQGWNDYTQQCEDNYCIKEGNIPANETNQYYSCSRIFRRLVRSELKNCTGDTIFSATDGMCVPNVASPMERLTPDPPFNLDDLAQTADLIQQLQESALVFNIPNGLLGKTANHQTSAPSFRGPPGHKPQMSVPIHHSPVLSLNIPQHDDRHPYFK